MEISIHHPCPNSLCISCWIHILSHHLHQRVSNLYMHRLFPKIIHPRQRKIQFWSLTLHLGDKPKHQFVLPLFWPEIPKFYTTTSQFFDDFAHRFQVQQLDVAEVRCAQKAIIPAGDHGMMAFAKRIKRHRTPFSPCSHFSSFFNVGLEKSHFATFRSQFFLGFEQTYYGGI